MVALGVDSVGGLQAAYNNRSYSNPPPDPRLNSILAKRGYNVKQGMIQQTDDWVKAVTLPGGQQKPYRLHFLYNPSTIDVGYQQDQTMTAPSQLTPAQRAAQTITPGQTSISFQLLFDRTYECWDGGIYGRRYSNDLRRIGCYADVGAFERMTGVVAPDGTQQNILPIPLIVIFGGGLRHSGLSYVGFITSASVSYTHFTSEMVPVRAAMGITMSLLLGVSVQQAIGGVANFNYGGDSTAPDGKNGTGQ